MRRRQAARLILATMILPPVVASTFHLSSDLSCFVPSCAEDCFISFLEVYYGVHGDDIPPLQSLCTTLGSSGYTVGEGAVQCIAAEKSVGKCSDEVANRSYAPDCEFRSETNKVNSYCDLRGASDVPGRSWRNRANARGHHCDACAPSFQRGRRLVPTAVYNKPLYGRRDNLAHDACRRHAKFADTYVCTYQIDAAHSHFLCVSDNSVAFSTDCYARCQRYCP